MGSCGTACESEPGAILALSCARVAEGLVEAPTPRICAGAVVLQLKRYRERAAVAAPELEERKPASSAAERARLARVEIEEMLSTPSILAKSKRRVLAANAVVLMREASVARAPRKQLVGAAGVASLIKAADGSVHLLLK